MSGGTLVYQYGLLRPSADDRALILEAYDAIPNDPGCGHRRALVTEDPLMDLPIAAVAAMSCRIFSDFRRSRRCTRVTLRQILAR